MNKDKSRYLTLLLRHKPEQEDLTLDANGYCDVDDLIYKLDISKLDLDDIVETNNKKRFEFNEDKTKIRATQGHSVEVDLNLKQILPPLILYHGTTIDNHKSIKKSGLKSMKRHHVHLTWDYMTAFDVALRYAKYKNKVIIYAIAAQEMNDDGFKFYKTSNNVFLVENVPYKYLSKSNILNDELKKAND